VATKSNFYFTLDEDKKNENVQVNKWIDTKDLTEDKLFEIYGYYSLMIDMHIA
jgi:hypothetical protein